VLIASGKTVILDVTTASLDALRIEGLLVADPLVDVGITAAYIEVMAGGTLQIGTAAQPYSQSAVITLTGARGVHTARAEDNGLDNNGVQRSIRVMDGGALRLFGAVPTLLKTKLSAHAAASANSLSVVGAVGWKAGDKIAVSLTDFFGVGSTEVLTLAADSVGTTLSTTTGLATSRWGRLQYPLDVAVGGSAMSLTPGPFTPAAPSTPTVLDERAEILNLSRRIVVQGANDADWTNSGFGTHVMIMGRQSAAQVSGVEFRRCGQRQAMGRYPFHWHMLSYSSANSAGVGGGAFLGDVVGSDHFMENSSIWNSQNRAVTIHGTCGVNVSNTFAVDIKGHAFFMEDGSERRNTLRDNVAMKVRDPGATRRIKLHDEEASGFWLTNPDNTIDGNSASDSTGRGIWNSFSPTCFGLSRNCPLNPSSLDILLHEDNTAHSNAMQGINTEMSVSDEAGSVVATAYEPIVGQFTMSRNAIWKNGDGGYRNRVGQAQYVDWLAADNNGRDFSGATLGATMNGTLLIGSSLNNATPFADPRRLALASYHYQLDMTNITAINYPFVGPTVTSNGEFVYGGGVFDSSDLYVHAIGLGGFRNSGWRLINSNAGFISPPPYFDGFPLAIPAFPGLFRYWALPGAIWDPHGYWGPAGNYLIPNVLFYTFGLSSSVNVAPAGNNGRSTPDLFYGANLIIVDQSEEYGSSRIAMRCGRLDNSNSEIAEHTIGNPAISPFYHGMRHFTLARGGRYKLTFPAGPLPTSSLTVQLANAYRATDNFLIGVPWNGAIPAAGRLDSGYDGDSEATKLALGHARLYSNTGTSIADVLNDATGVKIWQDSANNTVWIHHVGGLALNVYGYDGHNDASLERWQIIRLRPGP
jgi:hypothetical protein